MREQKEIERAHTAVSDESRERPFSSASPCQLNEAASNRNLAPVQRATAGCRAPLPGDCRSSYDPAVSIRIEQFDGGEVVYIALDPDGVWTKSEFPDELVTIDYNAQGGVIGIELLGSLARRGADAIFAAITNADELDDLAAVKDALRRAA